MHTESYVISSKPSVDLYTYFSLGLFLTFQLY